MMSIKQTAAFTLLLVCSVANAVNANNPLLLLSLINTQYINIISLFQYPVQKEGKSFSATERGAPTW